MAHSSEISPHPFAGSPSVASPSTTSPEGALVVDFSKVTVRRGGATILKLPSWQVRDGERWLVFGANGAGKTTALQLAAARMFPTTGKVEVLGETLGKTDMRELRPRIGLSSLAFADEIPAQELVRDLVLTAAWGVTGRWKEEYADVDVQRAEDLLAAFGISHLADRLYGTLSGGERKRVQIARSLMTDPELLLLDEPGSGLDLGGREELITALAEIAGDKRSPVMVLVTHHVEEIPPGITHMLLLTRGEVAAQGPIGQVMTSDNLTQAFGLPLEVNQSQGRWTARRA